MDFNKLPENAQKAVTSAQAEAAKQRQIDNASIFVEGSISQVLEGGVMFGGWVVREKTKNQNVRDIPDRIFIVGSFDGSVDGNRWKGQIWPAGTQSYDSVGAGVRTIPRWATTREAAIALQTK